MKHLFLLFLASILFACHEAKVEPTPSSQVLVIHDTVRVTKTAAGLDSTISITSDTSLVNLLASLPKDVLVDTISHSQIGVKEKYKKKNEGCNCGDDVEKYLKAVNLRKGNPWCAAFVKWCLDSAGIKNTLDGRAASAVNKNNLVFKSGGRKKDEERIRRGDVFTLYYGQLKRIGHTGFITRRDGRKIYTIEGNTGADRTDAKHDREGDGVYLRCRDISTLHNVSRWTN